MRCTKCMEELDSSPGFQWTVAGCCLPHRATFYICPTKNSESSSAFCPGILITIPCPHPGRGKMC